jgi:hypothetical protein
MKAAHATIGTAGYAAQVGNGRTLIRVPSGPEHSCSCGLKSVIGPVPWGMRAGLSDGRNNAGRRNYLCLDL